MNISITSFTPCNVKRHRTAVNILATGAGQEPFSLKWFDKISHRFQGLRWQ